MHQDDIVRLHRLAQLLHFVETGMHVCRRLQAGIVQRQAGTLHLQAGYFPFFPVGKQGQASTYQETVAFLVKRRVAPVTDLYFGQPALAVHLQFLLGGTRIGICRQQTGIGSHHLIVKGIAVFQFLHVGIGVCCKFQRHVSVHCQQLLERGAVGGIVLRHFGLHAHPFHFDFVHFEDARIAFLQAFLEEGKQLAGILRPLLQQGVLLVEHYQV